MNGPNAGGLVGQNSGTVNNSYSAGSVNSGSGASAGLVYTNSGRIIDSYTAANAQSGLVAVSTGTPTVVDAYWDTTDTAAGNASAAGTGISRQDLQIAVPAGLISNSFWGGNNMQFNAPLFPYLAWQVPANTVPVAVSGTAYLNQGQTPLANSPGSRHHQRRQLWPDRLYRCLRLLLFSASRSHGPRLQRSNYLPSHPRWRRFVL